jgi:mono/diheme cytochrome c family protein
MRKGALMAILAAGAVVASCGPEAPASDPVARGRQVYGEAGCATCHDPGLLNLGRPVGPPLQHIGSVAGSRQAGVPAGEYIRQSVVDPGAFVVPGYPDSMPRGLADRIPGPDLDALIAYLESLR